jgi:hypothetical protein
MKTIITLLISLSLLTPVFAKEENTKTDGIVVNGMRLAKKKEDKPDAKPTKPAPKKQEKKEVKK